MDFLKRLLPSAGMFCTARLHSGGGFIHTFHLTADEAIQHLITADSAGHTMYLAQATFNKEAYQNWGVNRTERRTKENRLKERTQAQAVALRSFFIDIDCGPEKFAKNPKTAYETQALAVADLARFCKEAGFPFPALLSSGHGLYAHWIIKEDVPAAQWKSTADVFKKVLEAYGFRQDPSRTSDTASVLRPVGTHNRKTSEVKTVRVIKDAVSLSLPEFIHCVTEAAKTKKIEALAFARPTQFRGINDEFTAGIDGPPSSALKVAEKCAQIRLIRDTRGNVPEPLWYAAIGLLRHCEEGEDLIYEWSKGHPDYSVEVTADKIQHHIDSGSGPTTCNKFGSENSSTCVGCPAANKVKSPIVLGRPDIEIAETVTEEEVSHLPYGYRRAEDGVYYIADDVPLKIHPYDLYPVRIAVDQSLGYETVTIRHQLPITKDYKEFTLRSALLHDKKQLFMALADNSVQVSGDEAKHMHDYINAYMHKLRSLKSMAALHTQMGWQADGLDQAFILGEETYKIGGEVEVSGLAKNIPEVAKAFHAEGDLQAWVGATQALGIKGMEPYAFAFLAGAFGAPLMRFTGYAGAMVALVGPTGLGKTLIGEFALSTYGDPRKLMLAKEDTVNALVSRLGLYGSLPLYLDEVSNIDGQELSDLLYRVTQGRDKARLGRDAKERSILNYWNTVAIASSNHSLADKLSALKTDASAEVNRIMEVYCRRVPGFGRNEATSVYRAFQDNFGVAGPVYIKHLTEKQLDHRDNLDKLTKKIDAMSGATQDERFWSAMSAVAIYGGILAKQLGLIKFEVSPVLSWLVERIKDLRSEKQELVATQVDVLGQFLDEHAAGIMVTSGDESKLCSVLREPRGPLVGRIMLEKGLLMVSRHALKKYLDKHYGSYTELKNELLDNRALIIHDARRVLGQGTYVGGTQQPVWVLDLNCPALGRKTLASVTNITEKVKVVAQ